MGCNCKSGKQQKLNNLDSADHLQVAFEVYEHHIKNKPTEYEFDEVENNIFVETFRQIYPNVKVQITPEHARHTIANIYSQYYGR